MKLSVLLGLAVVLGACSPIAALAPAPPELYELDPVFTDLPEGEPVSWQLLIEPPQAVAALDSSRVAASFEGGQLDYFSGVGWADRAPVLVQNQMLRAFEESGRIAAVDREQGGLRADFVLKSDLRSFQAAMDRGTMPVARVELTGRLVRLPRRDIVATRTFLGEATASSPAFEDVIDAFDRASAIALGEIVSWTLDEGFRP